MAKIEVKRKTESSKGNVKTHMKICIKCDRKIENRLEKKRENNQREKRKLRLWAERKRAKSPIEKKIEGVENKNKRLQM